MSIIDLLSQTLFNACGLEPLPADPTVVLTTLDWMEQSALGSCVAQTSAGYYIMLGFHSLGLATIVGTVCMLDLRILNVIRGIAPQAAAGLIRFAWYGLLINAISGVALFFSEANKAFHSLSFRIKILLMVLSVISTVILNRTVFRPASISGELPRGAKTQAVISICLWISVIIVGRMMSYLSEFTVG